MDKSLGELSLNQNGLAHFLKQQSYFRLLDQIELVNDWKNNLKNAQIIPLNYTDLTKSVYSFAIEIFRLLIPETEEHLKQVSGKFQCPGRINLNISNEWLKILYSTANSYKNDSDSKAAIRSMMKENTNISGSYILDDIENIDHKKFNIRSFFE
jgi:hypothetical protein